MNSLLAPQDRTGLLEMLRPPDGYHITDAIGATYSLDLATLLSIPVAMTFPYWEDDSHSSETSSLVVLQSLRRQADRITVFCQAGGIKLPTRNKLLLSYLEKSVYDVTARSRFGVFHPKVWVIRFEGQKKSIRYRLLCLTRNLTFDQSWDTALAMDGELTGRSKPYAKNHGICDLLGALPTLALARPVPRERVSAIRRIVHELRVVDFEVPDGFDDYVTWSSGIGRRSSWPFERWCDRFLVVSPFLSDVVLRRLVKNSSERRSLLISQPAAIDSLPSSTRAAFKKTFVLNPAAELDGAAMVESEEDIAQAGGLHAKLYLQEKGWYATVWTGSANATDAAFEQNVEFMVGLKGMRSRVGIDVLLAKDKNQTSLFDMLEEYSPESDNQPAGDVQARLDRAAADAARSLAESRPECRVSRRQRGCFTMQVRTTRGRWHPSDSICAVCWPVSLQESSAVTLDRTGSATFENVTIEALTSFFAFDVTFSEGPRRSLHRRFVLNLPLVGVPAEREDVVLRTLLSSHGHVLRFLLLLLGNDEVGGPDHHTGWSWSQDPCGVRSESVVTEPTLFELLVRTLVRDRDRLKEVARLVDDLRRTDEGTKLLPPGFDSIWDPVWEAYQRTRR